MLATSENPAVVNADEAQALDLRGIEPAEQPAEPAPVPNFWRRNAHLWILLVLTITSGFIRFYWIDRPSLWNDEAHTYRRVTGSFQDMIDLLAVEGFPPLLYEWYYFLGKSLGGMQWITPFWMRLVPCIFGTLMTPAMYFLARQMCSIRTSLVAAAIATCSAYLMVFAHDTKMYMPLICMAATYMACLMWWCRSKLRVAWLAWIASGVLMSGTHASGFIVLALSPLVFFTQPGIHWKRLILFLVGGAMIASGPYVQYTYFDKFTEKLEDDGWGASGITWAQAILRDRDDRNLMQFAAGAFLYSWECPADNYQDTPDDRARRNTASAMGAGRSRGTTHMLQGFCIDPQLLSLLKTAIVATIGLAAIGLMPWPRRWRGIKDEQKLPIPWSLSTLWIGVWLAVPVYYFYLTTSQEQVAPSYWIGSVGAIFNHHWWFAGAQVLLLILLCVVWKKLPMILAGALLLVILVSANLALWNSGLLKAGNATPWWDWARVFAVTWSDYLAHPLTLAAGAVLLPAAAWHYCDSTIFGRLWKTVQTALVVSAVLGLCWLVHSNYMTHLSPSKKSDWTPMFIPRYFSIVWPALCIALAVLLMRLPSWPLRWGALALVLGVNLFQVFHRFNYGEPPVDHIVADIYGMPGDPTWGFNRRWNAWEGKKQQPIRKVDPSTLTYVRESEARSAHPGGAWISFRAGKYYVAIASGEPFSPLEFKEDGLKNRLPRDPRIFTQQTLLRDAAKPEVRRLILWDRLTDNPIRQIVKAEVADGKVKVTTDRPSGYRKGDVVVISGVKAPGYDGKATIADVGKDHFTYAPATLPSAPAGGGEVRPHDPLVESLGPEWKPKSEFYIPVLYHWNWSELYTARRREYVRG